MNWFVCIHLFLFPPILFLVYLLHARLIFLLFLSPQVSDQCHFRREKPVLQWRRLPDASQTGDNPSEQGAEMGTGRTWFLYSEGWWSRGASWKMLWHAKGKLSLRFWSLDLGCKKSYSKNTKELAHSQSYSFISWLVWLTKRLFSLCIFIWYWWLPYCLSHDFLVMERHLFNMLFDEETESVVQFSSHVLHRTCGSL